MEMFSSLDKFLTFSGLKSGGASKHPDEGVCHFSPLILQMSARSEALLDHIADFLKFISSAQSFWFSLDTSYDHGCHLASRFSLDPDEYEALLIIAGLASYTRFGLQIKAGAWRKFLGGHRFVIDNFAIEFGQKNSDDDDNFLVILLVPTSTCQQKEKVERRREQRGCVIKC
jgi:hypothetical protein